MDTARYRVGSFVTFVYISNVSRGIRCIATHNSLFPKDSLYIPKRKGIFNEKVWGLSQQKATNQHLKFGLGDRK